MDCFGKCSEMVLWLSDLLSFEFGWILWEIEQK